MLRDSRNNRIDWISFHGAHIYFLSVFAGVPIRTFVVLDDGARPAELQQCHPRGESKFYLQMRNGGLVKVHDSCLVSGVSISFNITCRARNRLPLPIERQFRCFICFYCFNTVAVQELAALRAHDGGRSYSAASQLPLVN